MVNHYPESSLHHSPSSIPTPHTPYSHHSLSIMASQNRRGRSRRSPEYFRKTPCNKWDIHSFLDATLEHLGKQGRANQFAQPKALSVWLSSLKHIQKCEAKERAGMAKSLRGKWETRALANEVLRWGIFLDLMVSDLIPSTFMQARSKAGQGSD
ncbi:hypothetical protein DFP73DRAFT_371158 [Morchella snyderi]|nr:hypothetical protein DFP73DRAFT_371158 [Morchella snyderi]